MTLMFRFSEMRNAQTWQLEISEKTSVNMDFDVLLCFTIRF